MVVGKRKLFPDKETEMVRMPESRNDFDRIVDRFNGGGYGAPLVGIGIVFTHQLEEPRHW